MADPTTESIENAAENASTFAPDATPPRQPKVHILIEGPYDRAVWVGQASIDAGGVRLARVVLEDRATDELGAHYWRFAGRYTEDENVYRVIVQLADVRSRERDALQHIARAAVEHARLLHSELIDVLGEIDEEVAKDASFKAWSGKVERLFRGLQTIMAGGQPVTRLSPEGIARSLAQGAMPVAQTGFAWAVAVPGEEG